LCGGTHDISDINFQLYTRPIYIHKRAWIAAEAFIGPGVVIGEKAVVGARSVVFKDVSDSDIVTGNPAKFLKKREFSNQLD
jgi:putative colanic acid biosynthesis acetyltransferase WcaF